MIAFFHISLFQASPFAGYVYPNETVIPWSGLIVVYPYITGLVAGAFIASSFYHVFGMHQFKPVARFALLIALSFMLFVPVPLLFHLGHPERAFEAMITPHWSSAFAAFSYAAGFYVLVLILETWFAFRVDIVASTQSCSGFSKLLYGIFTLGSYDISDNALAYDRKWSRALAIIGIPAAILLHGYVGFVFGSLKSREWWSSDLMPVIFLLSAVVSGIALLTVLYVVSCLLRKTPANEECLQGLAQALWAFLIVVMAVEALEYLSMFYRNLEGSGMIARLMAGPIRGGLLVQWIGSAVALIALTWLVVSHPRKNALVRTLTLASVLVLIGVFAMRWNVVIGGQELSKSLRGLLVYVPPLLGRDGVVTLAAILVAPLLLLSVFVRLIPPWEPAGETDKAAPG